LAESLQNPQNNSPNGFTQENRRGNGLALIAPMQQMDGFDELPEKKPDNPIVKANGGHEDDQENQSIFLSILHTVISWL